jgi:hypothetical protein
MPDILLFFISIMFCVIFVLTFCYYFFDRNGLQNSFCKRIIILSLLFIGFLYPIILFLVVEDIGPNNIVSEKIYKVEEIKYNDGSKEQIIFNDKHEKINLTEKFLRILPENVKFVKEIIYSHYKFGVVFCNENKYKNKYKIVTNIENKGE